MFNRRVALSSKTPFNERVQCNLRSCTCRISNFLWVVHKLGLIYIETPKCGCTSIKKSVGLKHTSESVAFSSLLRDASNSPARAEEYSFIHVGFGGVSVRCKNIENVFRSTALKLKNKNYETDPSGKYSSSHYFGSLESCILKYPSYKVVMVTRDFRTRFLSAFNMYDCPDDGFRYMQLLQFIGEDSLLEVNDPGINISNFVSSKYMSKNHHFSPLNAFIEGAGDHCRKIQFVDIKSAGDYFFSNFRINLTKENVGKKNGPCWDQLTPSDQNKLCEFYSQEISLYS